MVLQYLDFICFDHTNILMQLQSCCHELGAGFAVVQFTHEGLHCLQLLMEDHSISIMNANNI